MNETRRFLRYVIPGLVFAIQVVILLCVIDWDWAVELGTELKKDSGIGVVFAGLLATGGLGFLFGALYYVFHSRPKGAMLDHTHLIKRLVGAGILKFREQNLLENLTREEAWIITTALWHERTKVAESQIGSVEPRTLDLVDAMHALGTACIATIAALTVSLWLVWKHGDLDFCRSVVALVLAFFMWWAFHRSYRRTARLAQAVIDQVLSDALLAEHKISKNGEPIVTWPLLPRHLPGASTGAEGF